MKVLFFVARDVGPSQALRLLADYATQHDDYEIVTLLGNGKPIDGFIEKLEGVLTSHDVGAVVVGMSATAELAEPEIKTLIAAKQRGIPAFCYADTFGVHRRPWFQEHLVGATLFHINEDEAANARATLLQTTIIMTGNPVWAGFFNPTSTRDEVRAKLDISTDA